MAEARTRAGGTPRKRAGGAEAPRRTAATSEGRSTSSSRSRSPDEEPASGAGENTAEHARVCPVAFCPVGMALSFAEASRPEVVQHLLAAGQELMLAMKAMVDARAEQVARSSGVEHIRIR